MTCWWSRAGPCSHATRARGRACGTRRRRAAELGGSRRQHPRHPGRASRTSIPSAQTRLAQRRPAQRRRGSRRPRELERLRHPGLADQLRRLPRLAPGRRRDLRRPRAGSPPTARLFKLTAADVSALDARLRLAARRHRRPRRDLQPALRQPRCRPERDGHRRHQRQGRLLRQLLGRRQPGRSRRGDALAGRTPGVPPPRTSASPSPRDAISTSRARRTAPTFASRRPDHAPRPGTKEGARARAPKLVAFPTPDGVHSAL